MLQYQFRPIEQWPGEQAKWRGPSNFTASHTKTLDLLEKELRFLDAKHVVIQVDAGLNDIRNDGMLKINARLMSPRVILSFDSNKGSLSYPCDKYQTWQENLRAIALSLEALRSVDRYGVTRSAEQYRGWERIAGPSTPSVFRSVREAAEWLVQIGDGNVRFVVENQREMEAAYRRACVATHPDHHPDRIDDFKKVQAAKTLLDKHFDGTAA